MSSFNSFNIFDKSIIDLLEINSSSSKAFIFIVDMNECDNNLAYFWQCLSIVEKEQARICNDNFLCRGATHFFAGLEVNELS